ncbi:hypothetical protein MEO39_27280, partial [Dolichospermum sp. ST_sed2]|nr:hypothetical protein [Dolichospermum sp. ST_sed2]
SLKSGSVLAENILATISRYGAIGIPSPLRSRAPISLSNDPSVSSLQATIALMNASGHQLIHNSTQPYTEDSEKWISDFSDWEYEELSDSVKTHQPKSV